MKERDINKVIEEFYNGNLSSEEELLLKEFLEKDDSHDYAIIKDHLSAMEELHKSDELLDDSFDMKVLEAISGSEQNKINIFSTSRILSGIAATALLLITIWITVSILGTKEVYGTINDPAIAFSETKKALQSVSENVNKGVKPAGKTVDKVEESILKSKDIKKAAKAINNAGSLNKINRPGALLKSMTKVTVKYGKS